MSGLCPRVYISYTWRTPGIKRKALWLANKLRAAGIDSRIDLYHMKSLHGFTPPQPLPGRDAWDNWQEEQVKLADRIIVFCTEEYAFSPSDSGVARDLRYMESDLKQSAQGLQRFIPVGLGPYTVNSTFIPSFMSGATYYDLGAPQKVIAGLADLIRRLKTEFSSQLPTDLGITQKNKHTSHQIELNWSKPMLLSKIPDERRDLQKIAGCDNADRLLDIIFVHGLGGDSWTTWMTDTKAIESFWPNWLPEKFPQTGLWTLGYAASSSKWKEESMPLADRGNQLLDLLANEGIGERPLAFITHSMGGIVAKQILRHAESFGVSRWEAMAQSTKGIAFIATPHSGAHIANFAELARAVYRTNEQVAELAAHDPRLRELHGWFLNFHRKHQLICRTYCERREVRPEIPFLGIKLPRGILVVDETSAEPNIPGERAIPLDEDHISICKPADREAQLYKGIVRFLNDCIKATSHPI